MQNKISEPDRLALENAYLKVRVAEFSVAEGQKELAEVKRRLEAKVAEIFKLVGVDPTKFDLNLQDGTFKAKG